MASTASSDVTLDPTTGLYVITAPDGKKFRVNADSPETLNRYLNSVNTGVPINVTVVNPETGATASIPFDPTVVSETTQRLAQQNSLNFDTRLKTGIVGNGDGTYTNLRTGETLTSEQAAAEVKSAGLPVQALGSVSAVPGSVYQTAQNNINQTVNNPSNLNQVNGYNAPPGIRPENTLIGQQQYNANNAASNQQVVDQFGTYAENPQPISTNSNDNEFDAGIANSQQTPVSLSSFGVEFEPNPIDVQEEALASALREQQNIENFGSYAENPQPISDQEYDASIINRQAEDAAAQEQALLQAQQLEGQAVLAGITQARNSNNPTPFAKAQDWRVRISLAPSANYLYAATDPGILAPLAKTNGVIFPYTPQINVTYSASYDSTDIVHTNYKLYNYRNSSVENINIVADFTAQDTIEANYLLAVIHFFRSATKMFFGQDTNPIRGVPPPLCYLTGHGTFGFDNHPIVITSFSMNYPNDVDYINAGPGMGGASALYANTTSQRLRGANLRPGGLPPAAKFSQNPGSEYNTRVPTKVQFSIACLPIITRRAMSNLFSLQQYATGKLLQGSVNPYGGGIW